MIDKQIQIINYNFDTFEKDRGVKIQNTKEVIERKD